MERTGISVSRAERTGIAVRRVSGQRLLKKRAARTGAAVRRDGEDRNNCEKD